MGSKMRVFGIDPSLLVSELTVGDLMDVIAEAIKGVPSQAKKCVDVAKCGSPPILKCDGVQFSVFPAGAIVEKQIGSVTDRFLELAGTGMVQIDFPGTMDVELYIANLGGNTIQVDFHNEGGILGLKAEPKEVIQTLVYTGFALCSHIRVTVTAAECYIRRLCYLPQ